MNDSAIDSITAKIYTVRKQAVILDSDLATIYGVSTRALNQPVSRHKERFPEDFSFVVDQDEFANLRSQFVTSSGPYGGRRYTPRKLLR